MLKMIRIAGYTGLFLLLITGCTKKDLMPSTPPINIIVKVAYDQSGGAYAFPLNGVQVKVTNQMNSVLLAQATDQTGLAIFNGVSAGSYDINASVKISKSDYERITGLPLSTDEISFNASKTGQLLNSTTNNTIELTLEYGAIGDWVIKQIYYAGSHTTNGARSVY